MRARLIGGPRANDLVDLPRDMQEMVIEVPVHGQVASLMADPTPRLVNRGRYKRRGRPRGLPSNVFELHVAFRWMGWDRAG